MQPLPCLLLYGSADEAAHECALREEEDDRHGNDSDQRRECELGLEDLDRLAAAADRGVEGRSRCEQVREADRDRVLAGVGEEDIRQEEVVPVGDKAEEEDERDDGLGERKRDAQERLQLVRAVDPRRVEGARRKRRRVVDVREVDAEREERERQNDRERAAYEVDRVQLEEDWEHERGRGDDHRDEGEREDELPAGDPADGEPVTGRHADDERDRGRAERVVERVSDPAPVDVIAECIEVLPGERDMVECAERERGSGDQCLVGLRRREEEPENRRDEEDRERDEDQQPQAKRRNPHQSSVRKSPLRVTMMTAPASPITSRSTAIAAAALKSSSRNAS